MSDEFKFRHDIDRLIFFLDGLESQMASLGKTDGNVLEFLQELASSITELQDIDSDMSYRELLEIIEDYSQADLNNVYTLFRGDCWTINNNFESSASITSNSHSNFKVTGTFRTKQDMIGIYWYSEDIITHPYISYGTRSDYSNVVLEFDFTMNGCKSWTDTNTPVSLTIVTYDGETHYLNMYDYITNNHFSLNFNSLTDVDVNNIKYIQLLLIPSSYVQNSEVYTIMANVDFSLQVSNIQVTNSFIQYEHISLEPHKYRLCEGYDDIYNLNPYRLAREMRKLGYASWVDLYIGASHYYEKAGRPNDTIVIGDGSLTHTRTEKMTLLQNTGLNDAFATWLDCYSRELKANDVDNLIVSVSMENLQCPYDWRQVDSEGREAVTGWIPSTFFYAPTNEDVIEYMKNISEECLDIAVDNNLPAILQMGEAWWWWNELDVIHGQPPCFYDDATKDKYYDEFEETLPVYTSSSDTYSSEVMEWLNKQLCDYSDELRSVVKSNTYNGQYMALFFPPSVTDVDRVPPMMREVNYLKDAYSISKLDILELEDYDWVIENSPHHNEVYTMGSELGFDNNQLHYYGGFVQYPEDAYKYWRLIKTAMETAFDKKIQEVFVWAGSQIRRDNKFIGYDGYEAVNHLISQEDIIKSIYEQINKIINNKVYDDTEIRNLISGKADRVHTHSYNDLSDKPILFNKIPDTTTIKDLNTYTTGGFYYCSHNDYAQYIQHCPLSGANNKAFYLLVEEWDNHNYAKQTLTYYDSNTVYVRLLIDGSGWNEWSASGTSQHTHGNLQNDGRVGTSNNASKNVVTGSDGKITTEAKITDVSQLTDNNNTAFTPKTHTHGISDVTNLQTNLDNKLAKNGDDTSSGYITAKGFKVANKSNFLKADGTTADANNYSHPSAQQCTHNHDSSYAPVSHRHNLGDINFSDVSTTIDYNTYNTDAKIGKYFIWWQQQQNNTNKPCSNGGLLVVDKIPNGYSQIFYCYGQSITQIWYRTYYSPSSTNKWSDWTRIDGGDKSDSNHTHDNRYYTETEVDNLIDGLLNRISFKTDKTTANTMELIDLKAYVLEKGVPSEDKTIEFYIKEE